jgi:hypothetical protein
MAGLFQAIFGGGKKEEAPKPQPAPPAPDPAKSLADAQKAAADQRRAAVAMGGQTSAAGGAGVGLPGSQNVGQKTLIGQ